MNFGISERDVSTSLHVSFRDVLNYFVQIKPLNTILPCLSETLLEWHLLIEYLEEKKPQTTVEGLTKSLNHLFQKTGGKFSTDF